ncbi:MAG: MmgE/PrpD family protein [Chloroflexota bacterium]
MMRATAFIHETRWADLPHAVQEQARRCLLDTIGAGLAGRATALSRVIHNFAAANYGGRGAFLWLDGREVSPPGAALANGMTVDAVDIHDGANLVKGHAGAAVIPAALASLGAVSNTISGRELLCMLVVGYEIALRAGVALHTTAPDYHASGAWNALGSAAVMARCLGASAAQTRHALGIAEYHGPRAPMMRCIDFPTMVKDGSGWGAMAGVSAALMARQGFTGAPAATVERENATEVWQDLGRRWRMRDLYFKPHAVCRWSQPAIVAALALQEAHGFCAADVREIRVFTFAQAARLQRERPRTTEEAQYSLPFPLAAALVHDFLGPAQLDGEGLHDRAILALAERVSLHEAPEYSARFPEERYARVEVETTAGMVFSSGAVPAPWGEDDPPPDEALREKFRRLAGQSVQADRAVRLESMLWQCTELADAQELTALLAAPAEARLQPLTEAQRREIV